VFKKCLAFLLILLLSVSIVGCSNQSGSENQKDKNITENYVSNLPTLKNFSVENLKNKAVLIVKKGETIPHLEDILYKISQEHDIKIERVEYNEEVENFIQKEIDKVKDVNLEHLYEFEKTVSENYSENFNEIYYAIEDYIADKNLGLEKEENYKALVEKLSGMEEEKIKEYIDGRVAYTGLYISDYIEEENLPLLILFNNEKEFNRIQGFAEDDFTLYWHLYNSNILDLSTTKQLETITKYVKEKKDFIVTYGQATCYYCAETEPIIRKLAENKNIPYVEVNLNTIYTYENFDKFMKDIDMKQDIDQTPTIIFYKEGKEVERLVGLQSKTELMEFINRNQ